MEAVEDLARQTRRWELEGTLPIQLLGSVMCAIPKDGFAERLIGLLPMPVRLHFRARSWLAKGWVAGLASFWGAARRP